MCETNSPVTDTEHGLSKVKAYDFIVIFVTAFAAPLASHACDLVVGKEDNPLSSEKLLCTYFALIAVYVIFEFLLSYYKETSLWKKGWRLGNSDALIIASYTAVASVAIGYYNTLIGTLLIIIIFILLIAILLFRPNRVVISSRIMVLFAFMVSIVAPVILLAGFGSDTFYQPEFLIRIWIGQFAVCIVFDAMYVFAKKMIKNEDTGKDDANTGIE